MPNPKKKSKKRAPPPSRGPSRSAAEMDVDGEGPSTSHAQQVFKPGVHNLDEGEELDYDRSAYDCMHKWSCSWPCLSFDVLRDDLGGPRSTFPHTVFLVAGTQAGPGQQNSLEVMKLSELSQGDHGKKANAEDDMEADDSEEDTEVTETAKFHCRTISQNAAVNRLRCMPQQPGIVATWSDNGTVSVTNLSSIVGELADEKAPKAKGKGSKGMQVKPMQSHSHAVEGFALGWSVSVVGSLASGDMRGGLHVWSPQEGGSWAVSGAYSGHPSSVEDIQWSPTEDTVFATACVDKSIRVYDTRDKQKAQITIPAHDSDVNVISWNALTSFMLASGSDDKTLKVWDLRALNEGHVAGFEYHSGPITSVEWCPHESSMLATTSEDNSLAVWDLALERDKEEERACAPESTAVAQEAPPQLLFLHAGMTDPKEVHWHPQIPGMLATTALDCFNLFKPSNVFEVTEQESQMK